MPSRTLSFTLLILGAAVFSAGFYLSHNATLNEEKISQAEQMESGKGRPVLGPVRRRVHTATAESTQERIGAAQQKVALSQLNGYWLYGIGTLLFLIGLTSLTFPSKKNQKID